MEVQLTRGQKISLARQLRRSELIEIAKKSWRKRSKASKNASISALSTGRTKEAKANAVRTRASYQVEINAKISAGVKQAWSNMSPPDKAARITKALSFSSEKYRLRDGSIQSFHSSWEAECADTFIYLGCKYEKQIAFDLNGQTYTADFVLPGKIIVEVKGAPQAWERWACCVEPTIKQFLDPTWRVYVLDHWPQYNQFKTLDDFLSSMDQVKLGELLEHP